MEDWCAEGIFLMFQVEGKNNFLRHFPTEIFLVRKKLTKNHETNDFFLGGGVYHLTS